MADEIFDFELDGVDGGLLAPEPQLRQRAESQAGATNDPHSSCVLRLVALYWSRIA